MDSPDDAIDVVWIETFKPTDQLEESIVEFLGRNNNFDGDDVRGLLRRVHRQRVKLEEAERKGFQLAISALRGQPCKANISAAWHLEGVENRKWGKPEPGPEHRGTSARPCEYCGGTEKGSALSEGWYRCNACGEPSK